MNNRLWHLCIVLYYIFQTTHSCTLIAIGKKATADGSVMVAHTDDAGGGTGDLRLVRVPAADHEEGSLRPVYNFNGGYPRLVDGNRSPIYAPKDDEKEMTPMGYIPQVPHTYAYYDQDYGLMNEVQLAIAESTCGARTAGWPLDVPWGKNLFSIAELSKIALERCDSARCAIKTMGDLATEYGFYDEDCGSPLHPFYSDTAEVLAIGDRYGEVWIFHILTAPDGGSAIWAAQRVQDDHIATAPNKFIIRQMNLSDPDWYLASKNVHSAAIEMGWWNPSQGPFDFTAAYGYVAPGPVMPMYGGRRIWRIFDLAAPSLKLNPYLGAVHYPETYPFSVKPDNLLTLQWLFQVLRDHYEGTEFDLTKGLAAGPFGNPIRYEGPDYNIGGGFERAISIFRTSFSFVCQSRPWLRDEIGGVFWYGQDAPHGTAYVPFFSAQDSIPDSYITGKQSVFNRKSSWWPFNLVNQLLNLKYSYMIKDVTREYLEAEDVARRMLLKTEQEALRAEEHKIRAILEKNTNKHADWVVEKWWNLSELLIAKYSNGYVTTGELPSQQACPGYPEFWLRNTEYASWPPGPKWVDYPNTPPSTAPVSVIRDPTTGQFLPAYFSVEQLRQGQQGMQNIAVSTTFYWEIGLVCLGSILGIVGTLLIISRRKKVDYSEIPSL